MSMCKSYTYPRNNFQDGYCEVIEKKVACLAQEGECEVNWNSREKPIPTFRVADGKNSKMIHRDTKRKKIPAGSSDDYHERETDAVNDLLNAIPKELRQDIIISNFVVLTENFIVHPEHYKASAVDGPGTKPILAIALEKFDTIGLDVIAMVANDMAPLGDVMLDEFINYMPCQSKIEENHISTEIIRGIVEGCKLAGIRRLGKGETASVDEMLGSPKEGYGFDVGGILIGYIERDKTKKTINSNYLILGFASSGPHCNGYTSLRHRLLNGDFEERSEFKKLYTGKYSLNDKIPALDKNRAIGDILLTPTLIYSRTMREIGRRFTYIQGVNNTGYGLSNFNRVGDRLEYYITNPHEPPSIFKLYQEETGESDKSMYEKFNMGLGFAIMVKPEDLDEVIKIAEGSGEVVKVIGEVRKSKDEKNRTILVKDGEEIVFKGYQ